MVIWIIGKSGSGKSFYAKELIKKIKNKNKIHIDGDDVRKIFFENKLSYDIKSRRQNAEFIVRLCKYLETKNFVVVCSILSIFKDIQKINRSYFNSYIQIYINSNISKLRKNNNKQVYSQKKNVVGVDIKFPIPYKSDLTFNNKFNNSYKKNINKILMILKKKKIE